jgi:hypothetical protein
MIKKESLSKERIEAVSKSHKKADKILVEKVIRALMLLEGLTTSGLNFIFKGGTALMLLFGSAKRLSIDIDIIVPDKDSDLSSILEKICKDYGLSHYKMDERNPDMVIDKEHYKLYFESVIEEKESYVLLDVLREAIHYKTIIDIPISSSFVSTEGQDLKVRVPDINNILGDKLTAFAPSTTGIPYRKGEKEMGMEIIKQLYDIASLCDRADNPVEISEVFTSFVQTELYYRNKKYSVADVIEDIIDNSMEICLRGNYGKADFGILSKGITQVKSFIFSESFHLEKAITCAAKAAYIASVIKFKRTEIESFKQEKVEEMKDWNITEPMSTKLNKLKKSNPEAFFYLYKTREML